MTTLDPMEELAASCSLLSSTNALMVSLMEVVEESCDDQKLRKMLNEEVKRQQSANQTHLIKLIGAYINHKLEEQGEQCNSGAPTA